MLNVYVLNFVFKNLIYNYCIIKMFKIAQRILNIAIEIINVMLGLLNQNLNILTGINCLFKKKLLT